MTQDEKIVLDPPLVVVIDVRKWNGYWISRFGAKHVSSLVCIDGTRCCLGFALAKQGWKDEDLAGHGFPSNLHIRQGFWLQRIEHDDIIPNAWTRNRTLEGMLAACNDMTILDPRVKADKIRSLGREHGIRFFFTHWDEADAMTTPPRWPLPFQHPLEATDGSA